MGKRTDDKGRVLRTGEQQRSSDGRYLYRYTDVIGNRKTIYAVTLQELREKEKELQRDLEDGLDRAGAEMTLNQLFDMYMKTKTKLRKISVKSYFSLWNNHVRNTELGEMKIKNIKKAHITAFYADLSQRGFCASTIRNVHKLIHESMEFAADSDMIRKNPSKNCMKFISGEKHKREAMTRAEQAELLDFMENSETYRDFIPLVSFLLNTGLRASELCGLEWKDVDMKENVVHVRRQLAYQNFGGGCTWHIADLKTENAERDIPLTEDARKALLNQRKLDMKSGVQRNEVEGISDYVFVTNRGNPQTANLIDERLLRAVDRHNNLVKDESNAVILPKISSHILRHTFASRAAESGLDPKTLQILMGHSDVSLTLNVYVQVDSTEVQRKFHAAEEGMKVV